MKDVKIQISAGKEDLCEKEIRLEKLDGGLETCATEDDDVREDLLLCNGDNTPIFRRLNKDGYSAIDLNVNAPGALTFSRITENAMDDPRVYSEENCKIIFELALNRSLNEAEEKIARDASAILRFALERDDEDVDLTSLIKHFVQAENSWDEPLVLPINLMLFFLKAPLEKKEEFREKALRALSMERDAIQAIMDIGGEDQGECP